MKTRLMIKSDKEQSVALRNYIFRSPYTDAKAKDYGCLFSMADGIGAFDSEGKLLGQVLNLPMAYNFYGEKLKTVGVNYVGVLPEARGEGIAARLMQKSIQQAYEQGQILSMLMPFSVSFYRKFGYDLFTQRIHYTLTTEHYPRFIQDSKATIERFLLADMNDNQLMIIKELYEAVESKVNGTLLRHSRWWERHHYQYPDLNYALLRKENEYVGYVSYRIIHTTIQIVDFIYKNAPAEEELWNFLVAHRANIFTISGQTTPAKNVGYRFQDPRINMSIHQDTMVRIIDVEAFLTCWYREFPSEMPFDFTVKDDQGSWNEGRYSIDGSMVKKEEIIVVNSKVIDVRDIAAIFLGPLTATQLRNQVDQEKRNDFEPLFASIKNKEIAHFLGDF